MTVSTIPDAIIGLPLFSGVSRDLLEKAKEHIRIITIGRNEIILRQGQEVSSFFCVLEGQIKLFVVSPTGAEKVVEVVGSRESFGEALMFSSKKSPVTAQAVVKSRVASIDGSFLFDAIESSPQMSFRLLAGLSMRLHHLVSDLKACCLQSSAERVAGFLLAERANQSSMPDSTQFTLSATKTIIASQLNLAPESLSRTLHLLQAEGLIRVRGRSVSILDLERLQKMDF